MRTLMLSVRVWLGSLAMLLLVFSCTQDKDLAPRLSQEISPKIVQQFIDLGFDVSDLKYIDNSPTVEKLGTPYYLVERDIIITPENLASMIESDVHHVGAVGEQYRTTNLVAAPRVITVFGYTDTPDGISDKMKAGLVRAIQRYNALNIGLRFRLSYGAAPTRPYDIYVVKEVDPNSFGAFAGFPSGGNPFNLVTIYSTMDDFSVEVNTHVIMHELGHSIGLRHTDYFDRSLSCGIGGDEGAGDDGAIHIPGTPTGFDPTSIMVACFSDSEPGEFGSFDITALNFLY